MRCFMNSHLQFFVKTEYLQKYKVKNHTHPCYELVYYCSGHGTTTIGDKTYDFNDNMFSIVKAGTIHAESSEEGSEVMFIGFTTTYNDLKEGIYSNSIEPIRAIMEEIHHEKENKNIYYREMLDLLTEKLVLTLLRFSENNVQELHILEEIINYIKMNANKNISIKQIAVELGYTYDYFRQMFIAQTGKSAKKYLNELKLENVKEYLVNSNFQIRKIADITGFSSSSALCSVFKTCLGISPNDYRTQHKNKDITDNRKEESN